MIKRIHDINEKHCRGCPAHWCFQCLLGEELRQYGEQMGGVSTYGKKKK